MRIVRLVCAILVLSLGAEGASAAPILSGSTISFTSFVLGGGSTTLNMATSLDFLGSPQTPSPGTPGAISTFGSATGVFAGATCSGGSCGTIQDIAALQTGTLAISSFVSLMGGTAAAPINFDLSSIDMINRSQGEFLLIQASGMIRYDGYDMTPAQFYFSAQGNMLTSFSASIGSVPVPEPASLALLGIGAAAASFARSRRTRG